MGHVVSTLALVFCCVSLAQAQSDVRAFPGNVHNRGETRILFWNGAAGKAAAEVAISYGRPLWKNEYNTAGALDQMTKGKTWRAGKNFWTFLDTNIPLKIGGTDIPVGMYYLVVQRSADGNDWSLAFIDPASARRNRIDAAEADRRIGEMTIQHSAPLMFKSRNDITRLLEMEIAGYPNDLSKATFVIKWGKFELSGPVEATM